MFVHILIWLLVCIAGIFYYWTPSVKKGNINVKFIVTSFFPIWLVQTLRDKSVGIDTATYVNSFRNINEFGISWEERNWEKGYLFLNKFVWTLFGGNYHVLMGCVSFIILFGIGYFILKNSEDIDVFWPVFFFVTLNHYLTSMVSLRQYCALAIGINVFTVLKKERSLKNYIKAIVLLFAASLFHISSLILGIVIVISLLGGITKKKLVILAGICFLIYWNFNELLQLVLPIVPRFASYIYGEHKLAQGRGFDNTYIIYLFGKIVLSFLVFCLSDKNERNNSLYQLTFLAGIGIVFSIMTTKIALLWRFTYFFDVYLIIFIPKVLNRLADLKIRRFIYMVCFVFASLYYVFLLYTNSAKCVPYVFCF